MRHFILVWLVSFTVLASVLACCCCTFFFPITPVRTPEFNVGPLQLKNETVSAGDVTSARVKIMFGAGNLDLAVGDTGDLFQGQFEYNVADWEPEVTFDNDVLTVKQGMIERSLQWGTGSNAVCNDWRLRFSPDVPLEIDLDMGVGTGRFDFTDLQIEALDIDLGAGDFEMRFDALNAVEMADFTLNAGASRINLTGLGNANLERMVVQGGVGDLTLESADIGTE